MKDRWNGRIEVKGRRGMQERGVGRGDGGREERQRDGSVERGEREYLASSTCIARSSSCPRVLIFALKLPIPHLQKKSTCARRKKIQKHRGRE